MIIDDLKYCFAEQIEYDDYYYILEAGPNTTVEQFIGDLNDLVPFLCNCIFIKKVTIDNQTFPIFKKE